MVREGPGDGGIGHREIGLELGETGLLIGPLSNQLDDRLLIAARREGCPLVVGMVTRRCSGCGAPVCLSSASRSTTIGRVPTTTPASRSCLMYQQTVP